MKNNILKLTNELNGYIFKIMNENEKQTHVRKNILTKSNVCSIIVFVRE